MRNYVFKKSGVLLLILALITVMMAGCGQKTGLPASQTEQAASTTQKTEEPKSAEGLKGSVTMWGWDEAAAKATITEFNKKFTDIKIDFMAVAGTDYLKKFQTSYAAGMDLPDIGWQERGARGALYELDLWEDLTKAPYNFDKSTIFDFAVPQVTNPNGAIVGIPWDVSVGALAYKKDLVKQYFGTDDPAELQKLLPTWDAFIEKGKEVREKSSGKIFMLAGISDAMVMLDGQIPQSVIVGNKANLKDTWGKTLELCVKMRDAGIIDKLDQWSTGWNASIGQAKHIFLPSAIWGPHYVIGPNDKSGNANWGLMIPPQGGYTWGGTAMGITKASKSKEQAWAYVNWLTLTEDGARAEKDKIGFFSHLKKAYEDPGYASFKFSQFGDQDLGIIFFKDLAAKMTEVRPASQYDSAVGEISTLIAKALQQDSRLDAAQALEKFGKELKNKASELEIN